LSVAKFSLGLSRKSAAMTTVRESDGGNLADELDRIHNSVKQLSQRVHVQAQRSSHEWDALRAELDSCLERLREAKEQVQPI
jgi:hypothetical protein